MIFYKTYENRVQQKDPKALRHKKNNIVTPRQQQLWELSFIHYKPNYNPQTIHCKGMYFGACQEP